MFSLNFSHYLIVLYNTYMWKCAECAEKALHGGVDIRDYVKTYTFNNFVYF